jgi:hypothetical protein
VLLCPKLNNALLSKSILKRVFKTDLAMDAKACEEGGVQKKVGKRVGKNG